MTTKNLVLSRVVAPEKNHKTLLEGYYEAWLAIERAGCPPTVLRCFIASLRLAIITLNAVEGELKILLELSEEKLAQIECEDDAVATFEYSVGRR